MLVALPREGKVGGRGGGDLLSVAAAKMPPFPRYRDRFNGRAATEANLIQGPCFLCVCGIIYIVRQFSEVADCRAITVHLSPFNCDHQSAVNVLLERRSDGGRRAHYHDGHPPHPNPPPPSVSLYPLPHSSHRSHQQSDKPSYGRPALKGLRLKPCLKSYSSTTHIFKFLHLYYLHIQTDSSVGACP